MLANRNKAVVTFVEIPLHFTPTPTHPGWYDEYVGMSPRSERRLRTGLILPLPDLPVIRRYVGWHSQPRNFCFHVMDLVQWQFITKSNTRMVDASFKAAGRPPLFWQFQFQLAPRPDPSPASMENLSHDDAGDEEGEEEDECGWELEEGESNVEARGSEDVQE